MQCGFIDYRRENFVPLMPFAPPIIKRDIGKRLLAGEEEVVTESDGGDKCGGCGGSGGSGGSFY